MKSWIRAELNQGFQDQALTLICYREAGGFLELPSAQGKAAMVGGYGQLWELSCASEDPQACLPLRK